MSEFDEIMKNLRQCDAALNQASRDLAEASASAQRIHADIRSIVWLSAFATIAGATIALCVAALIGR